MDVAHPYRVIAPGLEGAVLVTLSKTTLRLTGREVARLVKRGSQTGIHRALKRLAHQGILHAEEAGASILYSLNREHLAAPLVSGLAEIHGEFLGRLKTTFSGWAIPPHHASLFGSAARMDGGTESDIDLLIIRPKSVAEENRAWRDRLDQLAKDVWNWTGNRLGLAEISITESRRLRRDQPSIVTSLRREGVHLYGAALAEILKATT